MSPDNITPGRYFSVVAKPTGAACNLDCSYCFFLSKEVLWDSEKQQMPSTVLRSYLTRYLAAQPDGEVTIGWQGGEPTLRGIPFFREAFRLSELLRRPGQQVRHSIQTNGTLLDDAWGALLADHDVLVGLSIDGPADLHDAFRVNRAGRGTHAQVLRGWQVLQRHGVDTNILCTVNAINSRQPLTVYRYLRDDLGARHLQFIPIVERVGSGETKVAEAGWRDADGARVLYRQQGDAVTTRSVAPEDYGQFLTTIFEEWVTRDVGDVFVQDFDVMLAATFGYFSHCVRAPECGTALAIEHNGDVYACDHFVEPGFRLGNVQEQGFSELLESEAQRQFGQAKRTSLTRECQRCPVRWACHGGCPKDRFVSSSDGEAGHNYLCTGYRRFFTHATPFIGAMAHLIRQGRPASDLMEELRASAEGAR